MHNLPEQFVNRIKSQLGDEADDFLKSYDEPYVRALRINKSKNPNEILFDKYTNEKNDHQMGENHSIEGSASDKQKSNLHICRVEWENRGIYYDEKILEKPGKSPFHAAGAYYVQEASAMYPVARMFGFCKDDANNEFKNNILNKGCKILDLCAAPGGKTTQIADYMAGRGTLIANEIVPSRAKILSENIERMGVTNALVVSEEPHKLADRFPKYFDMILVDAPCSGEGMFRKHPEAADEWSEENVRICADRQDYILDCAAKMLASGGKITYSTCTFSKEEDEGSVERFLSRHPEFIQYNESHRIFPHKDMGEGHYCAEFIYADGYKDSTGIPDDSIALKDNTEMTELQSGFSKDKKSQRKKKNTLNVDNALTISKDKEALVSDFLKDTLTKEGNNYLNNVIADGDFHNRVISFGDNIYLAPKDMPSIKGLKVLRPGLQLGTVKNNRFEPAHALALALKQEHVKLVADVSYDEACAYIKGMTINSSDTIKGWSLVCIRGLSLGWGKASGSIIKNHYPKGLRVME